MAGEITWVHSLCSLYVLVKDVSARDHIFLPLVNEDMQRCSAILRLRLDTYLRRFRCASIVGVGRVLASAHVFHNYALVSYRSSWVYDATIDVQLATCLPIELAQVMLYSNNFSSLHLPTPYVKSHNVRT